MTTDERGSVRVLFPVGMLGGGFPAETVARGVALGADVIAVDGGSTDSGPHYLGTATAKTSRHAVARDLDILVVAAADAGIPLVVGSCGTSGADAGVDWVYDIVAEIADARRLFRTVARVYSEQDPATLVDELAADRVRPLPPVGPLEPATVTRCSHIVALMGHEPIVAALDAGAEIVLAGRATDTALTAAVPLGRGLPAGPVWHAAKLAECGGLCTTNPTAGGVLVTIDVDGFEIEPLSLSAACTPRTVGAHLLYENADPFHLHEPSGTLDATAATHAALDDRRVRVEGSAWVPAVRHTVKLEGAAPVGYQTMVISGIREPRVLAEIDRWCDQVLAYLDHQITELLALGPEDYDLRLRRYGHDAVLGPLDPARNAAPKEVGIVLMVTAADQTTATEIARLANPALLHAPLALDEPFPSFALFGSPAETERGLVHEFVLQHVLEVGDPTSPFRTVVDQVGPR